MIIYFIILGDISASFAFDLFGSNLKDDSFFLTRHFYVMIVAFCMLIIVFKKTISELKFASVLLFVSIILFILVFIYQLIIDGTDMNDDSDFSKYYELKFDR